MTSGTSSRRPSRPRGKSPRHVAVRPLALFFLLALVALVTMPGRDLLAQDRRARAGEAVDPLREIVDRARAGERAEALRIIEQFLKESPGSPLAARALLLAASFDHDAARAAERWQRIVTEYSATPEARDALAALARYRVALGEYAGAAEAAEKLLQMRDLREPLLSEARTWFLVARLGAGASPTDVRSLLREIGSAPWDGWASLALAGSYLSNGYAEEAEPLFRQAAEAGGGTALRASALFGAAEAENARHRSGAARDLYAAVIRDHPGTIEAALSGKRLETVVVDSIERTPTTVHPSPEGARLSVRLGDFPSEREAERFVEAFMARREEKPIIVEETGENGQPVFRVLVGSFGDSLPALDLIRDLADDGFEGTVVTP